MLVIGRHAGQGLVLSYANGASVRINHIARHKRSQSVRLTIVDSLSFFQTTVDLALFCEFTFVLPNSHEAVTISVQRVSGALDDRIGIVAPNTIQIDRTENMEVAA